MAGAQIVLVCERDLVESCFDVLVEQGFLLQVSEGLPDSFPWLETVIYRSAVVSEGSATVGLRTNPGQRPGTGTPFAGKYVVLMYYQRWPRRRRETNLPLAEKIAKTLVEAGMTLVYPAPETSSTE